MRIAITGATGFIGRALTRACKSCGIAVASLIRGSAGDGVISWRLGEPLPYECNDVNAVVHLACAALVETQSIADAAECDVLGSRTLIDSVRELRKDGQRIKFIFVSSQSARAEAANAYGQSKWAIETMLDQDDEIIVRPGLVYGDEVASVFSLFERLARLPVVPVVTRRACIQPIHVRELAECIIQIMAMEQPAPLFKLGAIEAMTFADTLRATASRAGRIQPIVFPVPVGPVRFIAQLLDWTLSPTPSLTERINGLIALRPMDTEPSLKALGRVLAPIGKTGLRP